MNFLELAKNQAEHSVFSVQFTEALLATVLCEGHALLVYSPGDDFESFIRNYMMKMGLYYRSHRFTADLMPSDISGHEVYNEDRHFDFQPGPIFSNVFFALDINRASPRGQSILIHVMRDRAVSTSMGEIKQLRPFSLLASQCAIEEEGTYQLPQSQIEEFDISLHLKDYSAHSGVGCDQSTCSIEEPDIHSTREQNFPKFNLAREQVNRILLPGAAEELLGRIELYFNLEQSPCQAQTQFLAYGISKSSLKSIVKISKALAFLRGREEILQSDLIDSAKMVIHHRLYLTYSARAEGITLDAVFSQILEEVLDDQ